MEKLEALLALRKRHLIKALDRLALSYEKVKNLPLLTDTFNFEDEHLKFGKVFLLDLQEPLIYSSLNTFEPLCYSVTKASKDLCEIF